MAADSAIRIEERDSRVAEWLDDKLQTLADLESLDALLQDVRSQQVLLRKQVSPFQPIQSTLKPMTYFITRASCTYTTLRLALV